MQQCILRVSTYKSETVASPSVHAIAGERSQLIIGVGIVEVAGKYELAKSVVNQIRLSKPVVSVLKHLSYFFSVPGFHVTRGGKEGDGEMSSGVSFIRE